jgi:RimJ/RimL family protein N-acetyltransferase
MVIPLPIETRRLLIRQFRPSADAEPMFPVYGDAEVMRFIPGGALASIGATRSMLEKYVREQDEHGFSSWAVVRRATGDVIGDVGFGIFEPSGEIELGYTLARAFWGAGYATEAATACLSIGLAGLGVPRIITVVDQENVASLRVALRIGMTMTDVIEAHGRPHVRLAATAGAWTHPIIPSS